MSLFNLFGNKHTDDKESSNMQWNALTNLEQLDTIDQESQEKLVLIFKHSTRCSISRMALRQFEKEYEFESGAIKPYFLDLLEHRDISNEIAQRFGVIHQSPQIILLKKGSAIYDTSHEDIQAPVLRRFVE